MNEVTKDMAVSPRQGRPARGEGEVTQRRRMRWDAAPLVVMVAGLGALIWFDPNGAGWRSWLEPQPVLSAATLVVGFFVVVWQLGRQHENTLEANRRQSQDRLKLDIYNEIAKRLEAASSPIIEAGMTPTGVVGELTIRLQWPFPTAYNPARLHALSGTVSRAVMGIMTVLETYEIAMPEFTVFRQRLADAERGLRGALGDFIPLAIPFVTVGSNGTPLRWPPTQSEMDDMSRRARIAQHAGFDVGAVIHDLSIEAQNYLLGGLFGRRLPKRVPTDPSMKLTSITQ